MSNSKLKNESMEFTISMEDDYNIHSFKDCY